VHSTAERTEQRSKPITRHYGLTKLRKPFLFWETRYSENNAQSKTSASKQDGVRGKMDDIT
jgi:hypothetical protein